jgi:hypothetical protein
MAPEGPPNHLIDEHYHYEQLFVGVINHPYSMAFANKLLQAERAFTTLDAAATTADCRKDPSDIELLRGYYEQLGAAARLPGANAERKALEAEEEEEDPLRPLAALDYKTDVKRVIGTLCKDEKNRFFLSQTAASDYYCDPTNLQAPLTRRGVIDLVKKRQNGWAALAIAEYSPAISVVVHGMFYQYVELAKQWAELKGESWADIEAKIGNKSVKDCWYVRLVVSA